MDIVFSKSKPIVPDSAFADNFISFMGESDHLQIATGYVSEDSILFLKDNITGGKKLRCDLLIGMHAFDGFTQSQYVASLELGKYLHDNKLGSVLVCRSFPYHGKFYNFINGQSHFASITGSANLTQIIPTRQRNLTVNITETRALAELNSYFSQLSRACDSILEYKPSAFKEHSPLLQDCIGVERLSPEEVSKTHSTKTSVSFELPLKAEAKSNLNIYFGKGRENTNNGIIRPRSWFEFEIIVPSQITRKKGYPKGKFNVVTDDGWMFECKTQGDYSKNFRSTGGLATFGMWVKGRMVSSGAVKAGDFITPDMLKAFGCESLVLSATRDPKIWLLRFKEN